MMGINHIFTEKKITFQIYIKLAQSKIFMHIKSMDRIFNNIYRDNKTEYRTKDETTV